MNAPTPELTARAKQAEFYETPGWAVERILDMELMPRKVIDPCAGRGVLGKAARSRGYEVHEYDLNAWPGQDAGSAIIAGVDYLDPIPRLLGVMQDAGKGEFAILMNPPFGKTVEFVERSMRLGARKIVMFQRLAFLESAGRRGFFERSMPSRVWICGDRATCWRGDIPPEDVLDENGDIVAKGRKGRSAPTPHAWFVWERGHRGAGALHHLYKE